MTLLQIDFPSHGPWGEDLTKKVTDLAHHLSRTPGMVWKIWTENSRTGDCGADHGYCRAGLSPKRRKCTWLAHHAVALI
jgi:hypothetical protein